MELNIYKAGALTIFGAAGAALTTVLGGWDYALQTLLAFMAADYITGLAIALIWHNSPKTSSGAASSRAGLKGLFKKGGMLLLVLVAVRLDLSLGVDYLRDAVVLALVLNELLSLIENLGLMGVPIPSVIRKAIDLLQRKEDETDHV